MVYDDDAGQRNNPSRSFMWRNPISRNPHPWDFEPDRAEGKHLGLPWVVVRHPENGHLMGYVGFARNHDRIEQLGGWAQFPTSLEAHGGITHTDPGGTSHWLSESDPELGDLSWVGFDAAHAGDLTPLMFTHGFHGMYPVYRTLPYMIQQCMNLANQLRELGL